MQLTDEELSKLDWAEDILGRCVGEQGVWADPTRYAHQCWTRDFVLAVQPLLLREEWGDRGERQVARVHLDNLTRRQRPNGQIPILFLDKTWPFLWGKLKKTLRDGKMSFMLRRYLAGELWNLTPGTKDSEILYLIGVAEYRRASGDKAWMMSKSASVQRALEYIEGHLMRDGLVIGCDWRDTMERELGDKPLLTNNSLLYYAYTLLGEPGWAEPLREAINEKLWDGTRYLDYPGSDRFDPLGAALAVLSGVVPAERYDSVVAGFRSVDSPDGVTIRCKHNPTSRLEALVIERTNGEVVWPFVVGFTVLALLKMGETLMAVQQFRRLLALEGFREWYDPADGRGYGAHQQLWSATLLLRAHRAIQECL